MAIDFPNSPVDNEIYTFNGRRWRYNSTAGVWDAMGVQGAQGTFGAQGFQGHQGVQGAQGNQGVQGTPGGPQGQQGIQGTQGSQGSQGFQGRQGEQGFQGAQGRQGTQGFQGQQGIQGAQGAQGIQGATGAGFQGVQGAQGAQGLSGEGATIVVENSSSDIYYPVFTKSTSGAITPNVSTADLFFQPSIGELSANIFASNSYIHYASNPSISAGVLTLDLRLANYFYTTLNQNITTLTLNNTEITGNVSSFVLVLTADGTTRSVVWPASFYWPGGGAPTITSTNNKRDIFFFATHDGGVNWYAFISGQNL